MSLSRREAKLISVRVGRWLSSEESAKVRDEVSGGVQDADWQSSLILL